MANASQSNRSTARTVFKRISSSTLGHRAIERTRWALCLVVCLAIGSIDTAALRAASSSDVELRKAASWAWPTRETLTKELMAFLDQQAAPYRPRSQVEAVWSQSENASPGPAQLDGLLSTLKLLDARLDHLLVQLEAARTPPETSAVAGDLSWLDSRWPDWIRGNVRVAVGRALATQHLYDEALDVLQSVELSQTIDPSTLLFYRAVCHHHLLQREACLQALTQVLERESELVSRYAFTARLMKSDIEPLEADSLDEISRLMNDVQRRLELGRAGRVVRDEEGKIIDKLDKMIESIEQQLQQQQQQNAQANQGAGGGKPMDDSRIAGETGPGEVDPKKLGQGAGWGDLPPAQRQEALQNITKELPSHYREVIEAYFKRLAVEQSTGS